MVRVQGGVGHVEEVLGRSGLWHPIGLGRIMASCVVFLTNAPKSSLDRPSANWIPGFFDLLTCQQDYLSYAACPLYLCCRCHLFNCAAHRTFITPDASRPGHFLTPRFMWIYVGFVIVHLCKEPHLAPISFVIKVTPSLSSVSLIVLGPNLDRLRVWCHKHVISDVMATLVKVASQPYL